MFLALEENNDRKLILCILCVRLVALPLHLEPRVENALLFFYGNVAIVHINGLMEMKHLEKNINNLKYPLGPNVDVYTQKDMHMPFPTQTLALIKEECAVRMCAPHTDFRPDVHGFQEPAMGDMMRRLHIRLDLIFFRLFVSFTDIVIIFAVQQNFNQWHIY